MIKPFAAFDVDGTLFKSSLLEKVIKHGFEVGLFDFNDFAEVYKLRRKWQLHNTEADYIRYIDALITVFVSKIKGIDVHVFEWVTERMVQDHQVRLFAFPRQLMEHMRQTHIIVIISGSPEIVVRPFVEQFKPDYIFGNVFNQKQGVYTGVAGSVGNKGDILRLPIEDDKVSQKGSVAIGDTVSDISMLALAEVWIMFNASKTLTEHGRSLGWHRVNEVKDAITAMHYQDEQKSYREVDYRFLLKASDKGKW